MSEQDYLCKHPKFASLANPMKNVIEVNKEKLQKN